MYCIGTWSVTFGAYCTVYQKRVGKLVLLHWALVHFPLSTVLLYYSTVLREREHYVAVTLRFASS